MFKELLMRFSGHSEKVEQAKVDTQRERIEARERARAKATRAALDEEYTAFVRGHRDG